MRPVSDHTDKLEAVFGVHPGDDHVLIDWEPMCEWFEDLTSKSPYLHMEHLGHSTDGRDLHMIIASSPETLGNLDAIRYQRRQLKDPSHYRMPPNIDGILSDQKPVVLITAGIHATEVGGVQMMPALIHDIATQPIYHQLLDDIILLIVPTLNPDGMAMVHQWYRETLGTNSEGTYPPALYHRYAGHDNNRDWYQHRLQETLVMVDRVHREWLPHVVIDLHQMGQKSPRYVVPPYVDPAETHVHPLIYQLAGELGSQIATDHTRTGNRGVCSGVMFDCYSPSRAYQHYHGGVRILAEAASAAIASPVSVTEDEIQMWSDTPTLFPSVHMALPWRGGAWHLEDIIQLHRHTIDSVLQSVAANANQWIADQWKILSDQVTTTNPGMYVIPPLRQHIDSAAARELIDLLRRGDVEVMVAEGGDAAIRAGSFIIPMQQPFGSYAAALLDLSIYPPGTQSYDVTSHCLPIHMGVQAEYYDYTFAGDLRTPTPRDLTPFEPAQAADIRAGAWLAIDARSSASIRLVNHALTTGSTVKRLTSPHLSNHRLIPAGSWIIADSSMWDVMAHAARMHVRTWIIPTFERNLIDIVTPRIGIYNPEQGSMSDYGWLMLWLERAGFAFEEITAESIVHRALDSIDTLLIPHGDPDQLISDHPSAYPERYARGFSDRITSTLRTWLHRGGHLIAFEGSVAAICRQLDIDLPQPLQRLPSSAFSSSGAVVRVTPVAGENVTLGIDEPFPAMYFGSFGYELVDSGHQHPVARFAREKLCISGAMNGESHLEGLHAIVQMAKSDGHFTAFAFRPHFRTQMLASEMVLSNAILQQFRHGDIR